MEVRDAGDDLGVREGGGRGGGLGLFRDGRHGRDEKFLLAKGQPHS